MKWLGKDLPKDFPVLKNSVDDGNVEVQFNIRVLEELSRKFLQTYLFIYCTMFEILFCLLQKVLLNSFFLLFIDYLDSKFFNILQRIRNYFSLEWKRNNFDKNKNEDYLITDMKRWNQIIIVQFPFESTRTFCFFYFFI